MNTPTTTASQPWHLNLLFTNDTHSQLLPKKDENLGGMTRRQVFIDQQRVSWKSTLVLDAGDALQGSPYFNAFHGEAELQTMEQAGYDVMTLGNHEFDVGYPRLAELINSVSFPILCANVRVEGKSNPICPPYKVFEKDHHHVAVIGILSGTAWESVNPKYRKSLVLDHPIDTVKHWVPKLRQQADLVVALSHGGYDFDKQLAQLTLVDVIIGGHTHAIELEKAELIKNGLNNGLGGTLVHQTGAHGRNVGFLRLDLNGKQIERVNSGLEWLDARYEPKSADHPMPKLIDTYTCQLGKELDRQIGKLNEDLDREKRTEGTCKLGHFVCQAMAKRVHGEVGIMNSGGLCKDLKAGPVTLRDLMLAFPHEDPIIGLKLRGNALKELVEATVSRIGRSKTMQFSGVAYTITDGSAENIRVNNYPIDHDRWYRIGTNDLIYLREIKPLKGKFKEVIETGSSKLDALIEYIQG